MNFGSDRLLVIDQDTSLDQNNDKTEFSYLFYILIAFVYAGLLITVVNKLLDGDKIKKHCSYDSLSNDTKKCEKIKKEFENKKFIYLIALGVMSVVGGVSAARSNPAYCTGGSGVAAGGFLIIIFETLSNWYELRTNVKIFMLGAALISLLYGSSRYYS